MVVICLSPVNIEVKKPLRSRPFQLQTTARAVANSVFNSDCVSAQVIRIQARSLMGSCWIGVVVLGLDERTNTPTQRPCSCHAELCG